MESITWSTIKFKLGDLLEWDENPVQITEKEANELAKSLDKFEHVLPYVAAAPLDGDKGLPLLDGHQRKMIELTLLHNSPDTLVDVRVPSRELTHGERQELAIRLRKNVGSFDFDKLANFFDVPDLLNWGFTEKELQLGGFDLGEEIIDAEPQISRADELLKKWKVKTGDLWQIGEHRLLCGDSTKREGVERVMGGERIELVWTDPPYGVAVGDENKFLNTIARSNRVEENLENDTLDEDGIIEMLVSSFDNTILFCAAGAGWYVAAPPGPLHVLFGQILKDRGIWRQTIQWIKNNSTFSPMGVCYHWQNEPIFFGWLPNGSHRYYGGRTQTTVWNIDRPIKSPEHPTMKPVELVQRAIENSSQQGEIVFDLFLGSGTTMVACQNLNRKCRAIEISPAYCSVVLQRMFDAFGITGKKIE
jgi:DNA modification methylase